MIKEIKKFSKLFSEIRKMDPPYYLKKNSENILNYMIAGEFKNSSEIPIHNKYRMNIIYQAMLKFKYSKNEE